MSQDLEQVIFHYILLNRDYTEKCRHEFFSVSYIRELFKLVKPHVLKYQEVPSADQVTKLVALSDVNPDIRDFLNQDVIWKLWEVQKSVPNYDEEWLKNTTKAFLSWQTLMYGFKNAMTYIKTVQSDVSIDNYEEICDRAKNIFTKQTGIDFNNNEKGVDIFDPEAHKTKQLVRFKTGYDFIDMCSKGGYWPGSLWAFIGGPKAGKSRLLQNLCAQSIRRGDSCAYLSFELQEEIITQRIGANLFNIPIDDYDRYANDENFMKTKMREFMTTNLVQPGSLRIKSFPTSATSVNDIEAWLLKEEERISLSIGKPFKFKNVYVDYINIMKNWRNPNSENTYMKVKQIAEDLRAMAMKNHWCVITVTQPKVTYFNASDMDMAAASESSALVATVDMLFAIISDVMMQANHECFIKILANRVSGHMNERKKFKIDETYMRLSEDPTSPIIRDEEIYQDFAKTGKKAMQAYNNYQAMKAGAQPQQLQPAGMVVNHTPIQNVQPSLGVTEGQMRMTGQGLFGS